jgi:hypothetical protein
VFSALCVRKAHDQYATPFLQIAIKDAHSVASVGHQNNFYVEVYRTRKANVTELCIATKTNETKATNTEFPPVFVQGQHIVMFGDARKNVEFRLMDHRANDGEFLLLLLRCLCLFAFAFLSLSLLHTYTHPLFSQWQMPTRSILLSSTCR